MSLKIAVLGGGNIGTQFACCCAAKGFDTALYTSKPEIWDKNLEAFNDDGSITHGRLSLVSDDIAEALDGRRIIFITYPAFMFIEISELILPHVKPGIFIGIIPGTGGAEFYFRNCIQKGAVLFGIQRVPSVARVIEYGRSVRTEGKRDRLKLAAIPADNAKEAADFMSEIFDMPCDVLKNYLSVTLTPSNPILHTTRLYTMFHDYSEGVIYPENFLFYGSWNNESSRLLLKCDDELSKICAMLKDIDLSEVKSLRLHYQSNTPEELTQKIRSIKSLNKLLSPMKEYKGGFIPDFDSRYFTSDFPYGLAIIQSIAKLIDFKAENINHVMKWYQDITGNYSFFRLEDFAINNIQDFYSIYQQKGLDKRIMAATIDKTRQDKTRQDKTRQDKTVLFCKKSRN